MNMIIMHSRYNGLVSTIEGYKETGTPLIGISKKSVEDLPNNRLSRVVIDDKVLFPSGETDDLGSYYFIPKIASLFNIGVDESINFFYFGIIVLAYIASIWGIWLSMSTLLGRMIGIIGITLLVIYTAKLGDVYVLNSVSVMALVPWWLYFYQNHSKNIIIYLFIMGLMVGVSNFIRSYSGTGVLLFVVTVLLFDKMYTWKNKLSFIASACAGVLIVGIYFHSIVVQRDEYLATINSAYQAPASQHPFWHSVYIGLGFLNNEYGIVYLDENAMEKVSSIDNEAKYLSSAYNDILKNEIVGLILHHPFFILETIFAKFGVCLMYFFIFANIGLLAAWYCSQEWQWHLAFGIGLIFNTLFGVLVMPYPYYLLGFIAFSTLYGLFNLDFALKTSRSDFTKPNKFN